MEKENKEEKEKTKDISNKHFWKSSIIHLWFLRFCDSVECLEAFAYLLLILYFEHAKKFNLSQREFFGT